MDDVFNYPPEERAEWDPTVKKTGRYGKVIPSSAIPKKRQRWLIPDMIPLSTLTVFGGDGSTGKSTMMVDVAAKLSRGDLNGDVRHPAATLILSVEDSWAEQMGPRLAAAGANEDLVFKYIVESYSAESGTASETVARLPLDLEEIADAVRETGAKLVVFDPALSFIDGDPNSAKDVRRAFDPVATMAQNLGISVLLIAHFNKGGASVGAKLSGSHAWRDLTRSYWGFAKDGESGKRVFSSDKGNYSKNDALSYEFEIVSREVVLEDGSVQDRGAVANIQLTELTVGDLLVQEPESDGTGRSECEAWLLAYLDNEPFEFERSKVVEAARAQRFSERTLNRAKASAGVGDYRTGFPASSFWTHPRVAGSFTSGTTGTTGEKANVSPGQNSYATVTPTTDTWHDSGTTGLTRGDAEKTPSHASHANSEGQVEQLFSTGICNDCGKSLTPKWGEPQCTCDEKEAYGA